MESVDYIDLYAIYKGDRFIDVGTLDELSERNRIKKASLYSHRSREKKRKGTTYTEIIYIGKELKSMYERMIKRLIRMRKYEQSEAKRAKTVRSLNRALIRDELLGQIIQMLDNLKRQEDEYNQAEQEGRYYQ